MDQVKIGKYIADKRKAMGLTQVELADKLGMSNKSVSKWERGVCLPDVSLYSELCGILGVSINEFLSGEDIEPENILQKSEETIISVTKDSKIRNRKLKIASILLGIVSIILCIILITSMVRQGYFSNNYIKGYDSDCEEYRTVQAIIPTTNVGLYKFSVDKEYHEAEFRIYEYDKGVKKERPLGTCEVPLYTDNDSGDVDFMGEGNVAVTRVNNTIAIACSGANGIIGYYELKLEDFISDIDKQSGSSFSYFTDSKELEGEEEVSIATIGYDNGEIRSTPDGEEIIFDPDGIEKTNNYTIEITIRFNKKHI